MKNQIIIHGKGKQTRIALVENGELAQLFIEAPENQRTVGDIYMAEVHKVMSGIRAAFISVGTPKDAFLHFSDVGENLEHYIKMLNGDDAVDKAIAFNKELNKRFNNNSQKEKEKDKEINKDKDKESADHISVGIEKQMRAGEVLQPGQRVLVQIVKEPIGSKGPRVSTDITIAGRFVVLIPFGDYVAVSKRIRSFKERKRLRNIVSNRLPDGFGIIVRTVAQSQSEKVLLEDVNDVLEKWNKIQAQLKSAKPPQLLYRDLNMTESLIRDLFAKDYNQMLIDDPEIYKSVKASVSKWAPDMVPNIKLYKGKEHIFDYMRVSADVESVFSPRVKMPSGGYLIFEQTEAMYVVDVNSGRYAAKRLQEENSLKTNLEAAREIAKQLRLRDIGGIIVVDFIDLKDEVNRKKVYDELKKEFRKDKAKTNVLAMSDFGLVQITRQRIRPSVVNSVSKVCPMCGGTGELVSQNTVIADIEAWLSKFKHSYKKRSVDLYLNPYLRSFITKGLISERLKWMFKFGMKISVMGDETISMNDYRFTLPGSDLDITETVMQDRPLESAEKVREEELLTLTSESKMDRSLLDVYDKKNKFSKPGSKYRDLDEDIDDEDVESDDDSDDYETESRPAKKVINSKEKYYKKQDEPVSEQPVKQIPLKEKKEKNAKNEAPTEQFISVEQLKEDKPNYRDAIEVAKEYAKLHNITPKLVADDDEEDYSEEYEGGNDEHSESTHTQLDSPITPKRVIFQSAQHAEKTDMIESDEEIDLETDSDNSEEESFDVEQESNETTVDSQSLDSSETSEYDEQVDEETDEEDDDSTQENEIEGISVKSSIQFVETESEEHIELEIYKESVEVLEKTRSESTPTEIPESQENSATTEPANKLTEEESSSDDDETELKDSEENAIGQAESEPKKKRGRKPIKVIRKPVTESISPKQMIADSTPPIEENQSQTDDAVIELNTPAEETSLVKKSVHRKSTAKAAIKSEVKSITETKSVAVESSESELPKTAISEIELKEVETKEAPKIRVSTTRRTKNKPETEE